MLREQGPSALLGVGAVTARNAAGVSMLEKPFTVGSFQRVIADAVLAGIVAPEAATPPGAASEP